MRKSKGNYLENPLYVNTKDIKEWKFILRYKFWYEGSVVYPNRKNLIIWTKIARKLNLMSSLWCSLRKLSGLCELCLTLDCLRHSIISLINSSVENVFGKMKSVQPIPCQWLFVMGFACKNYHYTFYESVVKCEDVTQHCKYHFAKLVLENIRIFQVDLSWRYDLKSF